MVRAYDVCGFPLHRKYNGARVNHYHPFNWPAVAILFALMLMAFPQAHACGLEPALKGGLTISYPGSLDVAVAVANARREGLLPLAETEAVANDVRLSQMLADLRRLQARLNESEALAIGRELASRTPGPPVCEHLTVAIGDATCDTVPEQRETRVNDAAK